MDFLAFVVGIVSLPRLDELAWPLWEPGGRLKAQCALSDHVQKSMVFKSETTNKCAKHIQTPSIIIIQRDSGLPYFFLPLPNPILEKPMNSSCFSHQPKSSDREGTARGWRPPWILDHMSCLFLGCRPGSPGMNTAILTQPGRLDGFFVSVRDYRTNHQSSQITWSSFFWMGWRENLQKRPTCDCENHGFLYINLPLTLHKIS